MSGRELELYGLSGVSDYDPYAPELGAVGRELRAAAPSPRQVAAVIGALRERNARADSQRNQVRSFAEAVPGGMQDESMRQEFLGFGIGNIGAAALEVDMLTQPQKTFRPYRMIIAAGEETAVASAASLETVGDVKVGTISQFAGVGAVPVDAFSADATNVILKGSQAAVSQNILVNIARTVAPGVGAGRNFSVGMLGLTIPG